ncbi:MAG TPA: KEOPS complex subunit Cgi121 [Methanocorpusculum sp.]|nr:KEOPS complex subunit Cgi121 [Methanocorpusculum sp.]
MLYSGKITTDNTKETIAEINRIADETDSCIVLLDAKKTAGKAHIECALAHAKRAFAEKKNIARTLSMEILLYVSAQRQCSLAPRFGLHEGENFVYVLIEGGDEKTAFAKLAQLIEDAPAVCASVNTLKKEFGITDAELEITGEDRIAELVCERVALMEVR